MFKTKLSKAIGQVDKFINELKAGIDINAVKVGNLDFTIADTKQKAEEKVTTIRAKKATNVAKQVAEQDALYNDIKTAEALVANLTNLKG